MHQYTSATSILSAEVSLACHGRIARLSLRAIAPSPSKKNSDLVNPRWRIYIDFVKKDSIEMDTYSDRWNRNLDEISDETRVMDQHVTSLEHGARQPRLAMEADGQANTKTQERTEGAAAVLQAVRGDSCTTEQKVQDGPKTSITFVMEAEPPDLPCREGVLIEDGATTPKLCLPSLEMRSPTAAGGLVPTGEASTASETTSNEPLLRFYETEEMNPEEDSKMKNSWTLTLYASYDSSSFWRLLAAPYCYRVVETKSMQNRTFDLGGSQGHLRACPLMISSSLCSAQQVSYQPHVAPRKSYQRCGKQNLIITQEAMFAGALTGLTWSSVRLLENLGGNISERRVAFPHEIFYGSRPWLPLLPFLQPAYHRVPRQQKTDPRAWICLF